MCSTAPFGLMLGLKGSILNVVIVCGCCFQVTVVSDDTNVWVNNPSRKRDIDEAGGVSSNLKAVKGMKRVQPLLGMLQHLILRTEPEAGVPGAGDVHIAQVHAPCQLLPRANSFTILSRMRRWSLYSSVGCAPQLGGQDLWRLFAQIPLKLVIHCCGYCPSNMFWFLLGVVPS